VRIVSLLASATEIVCALGAGDMLVGRSHECDNPPWVTRLPRCSEPAFDVNMPSREIDAEVRRRLRCGEPLYIVHSELIRSLKPDVVITQTHCEVCAVTPANVGCSIEARQVVLSASSLEEIFEGILRIACELELEQRGRELVAGEKARLENVRRRTAGLPRPRLVVLEWTDPIFAMSNWGPELVEIANGELALGRKGEMSSAMNQRMLTQADPDCLIVAPCGFDLPRTLRERPLLEAQPWWRELRAVREGRVAYADGNRFFNRSGMPVAPTAEIIAEILHGVEFDGSSEGVYWCR
jgi:iron complex transport system substrate-binding protein